MLDENYLLFDVMLMFLCSYLLMFELSSIKITDV